jgi:glycine cleavage system aminomethyltransferase T
VLESAGAHTVQGMVSLAGPVTVKRDGHAVIAHYGSVATEVAVCVKHAGLVQRPELAVLELRGPDVWLEQMLTTALGELAPAARSAVQAGGAWCARPTADRALIVAPPATVGRWRRQVQRSIVSGGRVSCDDVADMRAASLIGPRAGRVLAAAGVCEGLLPGATVTGELAGAPAVVVCEAPDRFLLLVAAATGDAAWRALRDAGAPHGLGRAGHDAYDRLSAASRPDLPAG